MRRLVGLKGREQEQEQEQEQSPFDAVPRFRAAALLPGTAPFAQWTTIQNRALAAARSDDEVDEDDTTAER